MTTIFIYSTSTGTSGVMHKTERAQSLIDGNGGRGRTQLVYLDIEQEKRQKVWDISKKKGIYPLIFVEDRFIGAWLAVSRHLFCCPLARLASPRHFGCPLALAAICCCLLLSLCVWV